MATQTKVADRRALKDRVRELIGKGAWARALDVYKLLLKTELDDPILRLRYAECLTRLGRNAEAVTAYRSAARLFEAEARTSCARAALRLALGLDPTQTEVAERLELLDNPPTLFEELAAATAMPPRATGRNELVREGRHHAATGRNEVVREERHHAPARRNEVVREARQNGPKVVDFIEEYPVEGVPPQPSRPRTPWIAEGLASDPLIGSHPTF